MDVYVGIDISKATFDVVLLPREGKEQHKLFPNRQEGFDQLRAWLVVSFSKF